MSVLHHLAVALAALTLVYFAALNLVYLAFTGIAWRDLVRHLRARGHAPDRAPVGWGELREVDPRDLAVGTMPARFAEKGDLHREIDDVQHDMTPLLEWYERDERDHGLGDMPYPPDYSKMPGEPPRVQPSRKNPLNWEDTPD